MVRLNGVDYAASIAYPAEKILLNISTNDSFNTIFTRASLATDVGIVNDGEIVASYACVFNGIEKIPGGYAITFNRAPMTVAEVEALTRTVAEQKDLLDEYAATISQQNDVIAQHEETISQQNDLITQQGTTIEEQSATIAEQNERIHAHDDALTENTMELGDVIAAITELGDLVAQLLEPVGPLSGGEE